MYQMQPQTQPWMAQFGQMGGMQPGQPGMAGPMGAAIGQPGMGGPMQNYMPMQPNAAAMMQHMPPMMGAQQPQGPHNFAQAMQQFNGAPGQPGQPGGLTGMLSNIGSLMPQQGMAQQAYPGVAMPMDNPAAGVPGRANPGAALNPQALQQYWNQAYPQQPQVPLWQQFNH